MTTECCREEAKWAGVNSGVQDWKILEKATTVILTRQHGVERARLWFSIKRDEDEDEDDDEDGDDEDYEDGDEEDDDENEGENDDDFLKCKISLFKPQMGVLLLTALVTENSFIVRSIAHTRDTNMVEDEWESHGHYFGKSNELEGSVLHDLTRYLQNCGINEQLAAYITRYGEEKQDAEQTKLQRNLEAFIRN